MTRHLRMKCSNCEHWNRVSVNKVFIEQTSPIDPNKVKVLIPMYEPLETVKCKKCRNHKNQKNYDFNNQDISK